MKKIEGAAWASISKITSKSKKVEKFSVKVKQLRRHKREIKKRLKRNMGDQSQTLSEYKLLQNKIKKQILQERTEKENEQLKKMTADKTRVLFWKERKKLRRNQTNECLTVKNDKGNRIYDPETVKETIATYYEKLYAKKPVRGHAHHQIVENSIGIYKNEKKHDEEWFNQPPTESEIKEIIENKKNGKSSTDIKNEMIKGTKDQFTRNFMPLMKEVWKSEEVPKHWKSGSITTLWKGKGDKECLANHRGITVSSAVGNILEEVIDRRMEKIVHYSNGQAGGIKGAATADHLFLLRGMMTTAKEDKTNLFLTFYDVAKAYDNADVNNMLYIMWNAGVKGKMWRILKNLNKDTTAVIKTRFGLSRQLTRENGGKQGSRIQGRFFSKQMDTLSEDIIQNCNMKFRINENFAIGCLEWVDDALSCTSGMKNQKEMLKIVDEFAAKNKIEWGEAKCQVMQVGPKVRVPPTWDLGDKRIKNTTSYKYLGDMITSDNKNKINMQTRENKVAITVRQINTTASSDIMRGVEARVILVLYEKSVVPCLIYNCESWTLTPAEEKVADKIGVNALKRLFNLPTTTPDSAVVFNLGQLYVSQEIDKKRFIYLHKLLLRTEDHWTRKMLQHLKSRNSGWAANITTKLTQYKLETNWDAIKSMTKAEWKKCVEKAVEECCREKIINNCTQTINNVTKIKTKTRHIHQQASLTDYKRQPPNAILQGSKLKARTVILSRHGMLECGNNFKGTMTELCKECNVLDNEDHRLNECRVYNNMNLVNKSVKVDFNDVYSDENDKLNSILSHIENLWEFRYANGRIRKT